MVKEKCLTNVLCNQNHYGHGVKYKSQESHRSSQPLTDALDVDVHVPLLQSSV